jgi:hypothetical protein
VRWPGVLGRCLGPGAAILEAIAVYTRQLELSRHLANEYRRVAESRGGLFFDPGRVITTSAVDGVHLEAEAHIRLGESLCEFLRVQFKPLLQR